MRLRDGRWLNIREYGDPHGYPVVYNHGGLMCARDVEPADAAARDLGIRLIAADRPGVAGSDRKPGRLTADWEDDVEQLLTALDVRAFSALGWSLGGQYALSLGRQARAVVVVAGCLPFTGRWLDEVNQADRLLARTSTRWPWLARMMLTAIRPRGSMTTARTARMLCEADRYVLEGLPDFTAWMREGLVQPSGVVDEYRSCTMPWGFSLRDVPAPAVLWQGTEDTLVPAHWAEEILAALPNGRLASVAGAGHFVAYRHWQQVLQDALPADMPQGSG